MSPLRQKPYFFTYFLVSDNVLFNITYDLFPAKGKAGHTIMAEEGQVAINAFFWRNENYIESDTDL